jgi:hypothetical protein
MADWARTPTERRGFGALDALEAQGWLVLTPRVRRPATEYDEAGVDHVVVGPTGAYALDVQDWPGSLTVRNDLLRVDERSRDRVVRETVSLVAELAAVVPTDLRTHVHPVVVVDRVDPVLLTTRDVLVCSWASLAAAVTGRPAVWGPGQVAFASVMLRGRLEAAGEASAGDPYARYHDVVRPRPRRASVPDPRAAASAPALADRLREAFRSRS